MNSKHYKIYQGIYKTLIPYALISKPRQFVHIYKHGTSDKDGLNKLKFKVPRLDLDKADYANFMRNNLDIHCSTLNGLEANYDFKQDKNLRIDHDLPSPVFDMHQKHFVDIFKMMHTFDLSDINWDAKTGNHILQPKFTHNPYEVRKMLEAFTVNAPLSILRQIYKPSYRKSSDAIFTYIENPHLELYKGILSFVFLRYTKKVVKKVFKPIPKNDCKNHYHFVYKSLFETDLLLYKVNDPR